MDASTDQPTVLALRTRPSRVVEPVPAVSFLVRDA